MKKLIRSVIIFLISITLITGCGRSFWNSNQKVSDEIIEAIIDGINNKDVDRIKNIFSVNL